MKYLILIFFSLAQFLAFSQKSQRHLDEWDTLRLKTNAELKRYDEILRREQCYSDTVKKKDVVVVTHYSSNKKKLRTISNYFDTTGCLRGIYTEYYNKEGQLEYESSYKKCCGQKLPDDETCYEFVTDYARYQYDSQGRVILRIYHISTPMTIKETYTYSADGNKQTKREKIREPQFWN